MKLTSSRRCLDAVAVEVEQEAHDHHLTAIMLLHLGFTALELTSR